MTYLKLRRKELFLQAEQTDNMTTIFTQNDNFDHLEKFVYLLSF